MNLFLFNYRFEFLVCLCPGFGSFGRILYGLLACFENLSCLLNAFKSAAGKKLNGDIAQNGCFNGACHYFTVAG